MHDNTIRRPRGKSQFFCQSQSLSSKFNLHFVTLDTFTGRGGSWNSRVYHCCAVHFFFVTFSRLCYLADLSMLWVSFFSFSEGDGWHRRPRQRIQHGALPGSELWQTEGGQRRRRSPATETKETILAWVSLSVISITVTKICFSQLARHTQSTQLQHIQSSQSPHLTHVWLSCLCKPTCYWHSFISRFIALRVPSCWANRRKQVWLQFCTTRPQSMTPDGRENKHWVLLLII